ncbi:MAG TPA: 2-isopropylmalate synthase [Bacillota bacterium]|jgi:2-isopropylmalate synthase
MSERVYIFDTTLRDGEQSPGVALTVPEKLEVARQLARLGVDVIEAGFPISSPGDFAAVKAVADEVRGPVITGLARTDRADIDRAWEAVRGAAKPRVHIFIATSEIHMKHKLNKVPTEVITATREAVSYAVSLGAEVEFSAEDATRSDPDFLVRVFREATRAGATILNVPDTVGYTTPGEFGRLIRYLRDHVDVPCFSVHCHNDLGLATANSLAAVEAGATQVECTVNGIGERAGNTSLEEVVMALRTRRERYDCGTGVDTRQIARSSHLVVRLTGMKVQPNKAIVGANAFAHQSGIHQDGVLKMPLTYEIMKPEDVGLVGNSIVLGKLSGRHALQKHLSDLGYELDQAQLKRVFVRFKELADKKRDLSDLDLVALVEDESVGVAEADQGTWTLEEMQFVSGSRVIPTATVLLGTPDGPRKEASSGLGPVDAVFAAIARASGTEPKLLDYDLKAVTSGRDALGEVVLKLGLNGRTAIGHGVSTDVIEASARAYMAAFNKLMGGPATGKPVGEAAKTVGEAVERAAQSLSADGGEPVEYRRAAGQAAGGQSD